jgi:hypothetical protein
VITHNFLAQHKDVSIVSTLELIFSIRAKLIKLNENLMPFTGNLLNLFIFFHWRINVVTVKSSFTVSFFQYQLTLAPSNFVVSDPVVVTLFL